MLLSLYRRMAVAFCMPPVPKTRISHVQSVSSAEITVHHLLHVFTRSESCLFQLQIHRCKAPCSGSVGGFPSQGHTLRSKQQKSVYIYLIGFFFSILHWCVLHTDMHTMGACPGHSVTQLARSAVQSRQLECNSCIFSLQLPTSRGCCV